MSYPLNLARMNTFLERGWKFNVFLSLEFTSSPTTFDCIAFGFLQTLGFKELKQSWLGDLVQGKKNLVSFCNNFIGNSYFPLKGERKMDQMLKLKPLQVRWNELHEFLAEFLGLL